MDAQASAVPVAPIVCSGEIDGLPRVHLKTKDGRIFVWAEHGVLCIKEGKERGRVLVRQRAARPDAGDIDDIKGDFADVQLSLDERLVVFVTKFDNDPTIHAVEIATGTDWLIGRGRPKVITDGPNAGKLTITGFDDKGKESVVDLPRPRN